NAEILACPYRVRNVSILTGRVALRLDEIIAGSASKEPRAASVAHDESRTRHRVRCPKPAHLRQGNAAAAGTRAQPGGSFGEIKQKSFQFKHGYDFHPATLRK